MEFLGVTMHVKMKMGAKVTLNFVLFGLAGLVWFAWHGFKIDVFSII